MTKADDVILEFLEESGAAHNKKGLEINLELRDESVSYSTIQRRISTLEGVGLIREVREEGAWYQITQRGIEYLEGEEDLRDVDKPE